MEDSRLAAEAEQDGPAGGHDDRARGGLDAAAVASPLAGPQRGDSYPIVVAGPEAGFCSSSAPDFQA
ncbi:MAG TPA: hypothetical protein PK271_12290, partial [Hyphomicrobium sp.]|uniref:hypothetical protein n=1 Tax=Hyphomicrobium sp. TaxID=82 RepID=UPI002BE73927